MAKKNTRVILPGGIQGLVHDLQSGKQTIKHDISDLTPSPSPTERGNADSAQPDGKGVQGSAGSDNVTPNTTLNANGNTASTTANGNTTADSKPSPTPSEGSNASVPSAASNGSAAPAGSAPSSSDEKTAQNKPLGDLPGRSYSPGRPPKQNTMKEYHIVKDDSQDSWQLFLDMAKQYKDGGGKLATIYIDSTLKTVLDRMKYAGPEKLPTSAILSSIVARFIYDHEEDIRKALFSGNIL